MILQIQLSCEKIMLPLVQNTAVKFYIKGVQSNHRFDVSVPFSICYVGPLLNVLLSIDKDFYGSELSEYIRSKVLFTKKSIKRIFAKIAKELDDENKRIKAQAVKRTVDLKKQLIEVDESKVSEEVKDSLRSEMIFESLLQAHAQALSE